ncbi:MBL fold metallo-hydrolase [Candidatus Micrarchaeota archaeon]|nr:MAG: MBL fold metallo-hydrolase [Candidatus Micrarchaeota archaeon]
MDIHFIPGNLNSSNSILVGNVLIDPGIEEDRSIVEALKRLGYEKRDIERIILTHAHYDHSSAARLFDCPTYAFGADATALKKGDDDYTLSKFFGDSLRIENIRTLKDDQLFNGLKIISTPGHTDGSICLHYEDYLISGDTVFAYGIGRYDLPGGSLENLTLSLKKLSQLNFEVLLPGHGPIGNKDSVMDALRQIDAFY